MLGVGVGDGIVNRLGRALVVVEKMLSEPDASRSGKSGLVSASMRRYLKLVIGSVHLLEGHKRAGE